MDNIELRLVQEMIKGPKPVYISADNKVAKVVEPKDGKTFRIKELYELLGVDMIQIVELADGNLMILDEEGKLKDEATVNEIASALYSINRMNESEVEELMKQYEARGFATIRTSDTDLGFPMNSIVGNVVVCSPKYLEE